MKKEDNGFYELPKLEKITWLEILLGILALLYISVPTIILLIICAIVKIMKIDVSPILITVIGVILYVGWTIRLCMLPGKRKPFAPKIKKKYVKYRFNVKDAYKKVTLEPDTDGEVMDSLYRNGALYFFADPDQDFINFVYNYFNDNFKIKDEHITIHTISRKAFLKHFSYYEDIRYKHQNIYVISYEDIGASTEALENLVKTDMNKYYCWSYFSDFGYLVDGKVFDKDYGTWYRYKGKANML